jgi:hypothetical protein
MRCLACSARRGHTTRHLTGARGFKTIAGRARSNGRHSPQSQRALVSRLHPLILSALDRVVAHEHHGPARRHVIAAHHLDGAKDDPRDQAQEPTFSRYTRVV